MKITTKRKPDIMEDVSKIISEEQKLKQEKHKVRNRLIERQSKVDTQINELYHLIELNNLSQRDKVSICDELHILLTERREIKETMNVINGISSNLDKEVTFIYEFTNPVCIEVSKKNIKLKRAIYEENKDVKSLSIETQLNETKDSNLNPIKKGQIYDTGGYYITITGMGPKEIVTINVNGKIKNYSRTNFEKCVKDGIFVLKEEN